MNKGIFGIQIIMYLTNARSSKYTFVHFAILLIRQVLGVVPLPVPISFAVEALSFMLGSSFGIVHWNGNFLAILLEVPFYFPLPFFLKLVVLLTINT